MNVVSYGEFRLTEIALSGLYYAKVHHIDGTLK